MFFFILKNRRTNYLDYKIPDPRARRTFAREEMKRDSTTRRHPWFCRRSNGFRRNLNNCQMPRVALPGSFGGNRLVAPSSGLPPQSLVYSQPARSLSSPLSTCSSRSRHFKINLSFALARSCGGASLFPSIWLVNVVWIYFGAPRQPSLPFSPPSSAQLSATISLSAGKGWERGRGGEDKRERSRRFSESEKSTRDVFLRIDARERKRC